MAACYSTPQPDCGFVCGPAGDCPTDYACAADNRCHRNGTPESLMCAPPDAAISMRDTINFDSPGPDAPADADVTAPLVMSTVPAAGATGVSRTATIIVTFDEAVFNVDTTTFTVTIGGNAVTGTVTPQDAQTYVFAHGTMFMPNATVIVSLSSAITDFVGNALVTSSFQFETGT